LGSLADMRGAKRIHDPAATVLVSSQRVDADHDAYGGTDFVIALAVMAVGGLDQGRSQCPKR
jgi:hypothetical protein